MYKLVHKIIGVTAYSEDDARVARILNILLVSCGVLFFIAFLISLFKEITGLDQATDELNAIPALSVFVLFAFFILLYFLSRKGLFKIVSYIFIATLFLFALYMTLNWGVDVPAAIVLYPVTIVLAGILLSTKFAFISAAVIGVAMLTAGYLQKNNILQPNLYWKNEIWEWSDILMISLIYFVIATVSWLSNRELEKSLTRARKSEVELKKERDLLEIKVEERARELKETQAEKMAQLYRFAEFGRLSSGLFHDLINPLNAVSLNIEKLKNSSQNMRAPVDTDKIDASAIPVSQAAEYIDKAIRAAKKLEDLVAAVRKQLVRQESKTVFSLNQEINDVIDVLSYKAQKNKVQIYFSHNEDIKMFGDAIKFNQIMLNLIANAVDAYTQQHQGHKRYVHISLREENSSIVLSVKDEGVGIPANSMQKIFEPFFTTKTGARGIGIGLSMVKRIVEKDFGGTIEVKSAPNLGSEFKIIMPKNQPGML